MDCRNISHFLSFLLILVLYFLYKESQENIRIYNICVEQEAVIQEQKAAMYNQSSYIKTLEYYYSYYYNNETNSPINQQKKFQ